MDRSDEQLVEAYLGGDGAAFEELYGRYELAVFRFLLSLGGTRDQAEDAFQAAWLKAIDGLGEFRGGTFKSWLFRIAHRTWLDQVRSAWERRRVMVEEGEDWESLPIDRSFLPSFPSPLEEAELAERRRLLRTALEQIPDQMRQAVLLRIDGELAYREIAEVLKCPLGTALWRVRAAEEKLRKILNPEPLAEGVES